MRYKIKQICYFSSFSTFRLGQKRICQRADRRLIVLHPKQNTESEPKEQICFDTVSANFFWASVKGLTYRMLANKVMAKPKPYLNIQRIAPLHRHSLLLKYLLDRG